jgi:transcriptional regulator with XRE-family HTH domain
MPPTIAENLRRIMKTQRVDAVELSRRLGYQDRAMVDHWLAGRRAVGHRNLARLAEALSVPAEQIDPAETAYTPSQRKARSEEKKQHAEASSAAANNIPPSHSHVAAPPPNPTGVDMGSGDSLFAQVEGAWKLLRDDAERRAFVEHVRGFVHQSTAPEPAAKKASR